MCGISCIFALREHTKEWIHPSPFATSLANLPPPPPTRGSPFDSPFDSQEAIRDSRERAALLAELDSSLHLIKHRGPDSRGHWISADNRVVLGHVRLSINDLSPDGAQPFHSPDGKIHAVVNGEFYDYDRIRKEIEDTTGYVFRSRSDSEIVIALYMHHGLNFMHYLRGEFSVVLYDEETQELIALRDRFGIKPLFWTVQQDPRNHQRSRLLIAAEMKAFLPLNWVPEWDVKSLMEAGWNHDDRTIFTEVQKVRPGHYLSCAVGHVEEKRYWEAEYPDKRTVDTRTPQEMIEGVRERLLEAIKLRLRADVPVGVYLSGGLDSSAIAGMVTHLVREQGITMGSAPPNERVCCFSIAFDEDSGFDESSIASRTAEHLGVKYEKKLMSEDELAIRFEDATWHIEQTNPDLNFVGKFALSEVPEEAGYKVVLTGEGADEHFAGYPLFLPDYLREADAAWAHENTLPESERETQLNLAEAAAKAYYDSVGADTSIRGPSVPRKMLNNITTVSSMAAFQPDVFEDWTTLTHGTTDVQRIIANNIDGIARQKILNSWHPLHAAEYVWSKGHLPNIFLTCLGDRTEMAHSIEARTPLLDHHLTEYVNNLPPSSKIRWLPPSEENPEGRFVEKWVLREAAKPFITQELYERKKHPYSAPTTWPRGGPLHQLLARLVTRENVEALGFVRWNSVHWLVDHAFGPQGRPGAMRKALVVAEWVVLSKRFGVRRARPTPAT